MTNFITKFEGFPLTPRLMTLDDFELL